MIDTVLDLVELVRIDDKTIAKKYAQVCSHDTRGQHAVSMIMEANLLDQSFNS
jgi:hypothetical protein